ncbi:MFS transporter [Streptomyces sp. NPDC021139]|uniref:MFS transporter n=1 Tax=unclassified Streptomyces TaxID=2593676 RepID=UPI0033F01401
MALRLIQGFAAGGEFGSAASFLADSAPRRRRGFGVSWLEVGSLLGFLAGSFVFLLLSAGLTDAQPTSWGWRIPFLVAAPLGVVGYVIRNKIEDTPEYRALEANDTVPRSPVRELLRTNRRQVIQAAGLVAAMHVPFYMVLTYLVTYETDHLHHSADSAALLSTVISLLGLVLVPVFGALSDRVGRKPVFVGATAALLVLATPAFWLMRTGQARTWIAGLLLGANLAAILGTYAVWSAEVLPTRTRQSGLSIAYNITAALFAGTVPYPMTVLISATGSTLVPGPYMMLFAVGGLVAALSLKETAGSVLLRPEDVSEAPAGRGWAPRTGSQGPDTVQQAQGARMTSPVGFTLVQLRYFLVAAEHGSMTEASAELHMAQSAVSAAVYNLERDLRVQLFIRRRGRGLTLTPAGERLRQQARELLGRAREVEREARGDGGTISGPVTVGAL